MAIDIKTLCERIEASVRGAKATLIDKAEVTVSFSNRPDVEIALLTPYYQNRILNKKLSTEDVNELIKEVHRISNNFERKEWIDKLRKVFVVGSRIEATSFFDRPYSNLPIQGTVLFVDDIGSVHIHWDDGNTFALLPDVDQYKLIK